MKMAFPDPETRALERYLRRPTRRRLAAFVRVSQGHIWHVALRLAGPADDAADLCQDVFLGLLHRPPPAGSVRSARGWLAARLATVARDRRRSAERRARRESLGAQRITEEERLAADEVEAVRCAVEDLPERLRAVVELRYFAGLQNREVAEALGVSEPTVDKDLRRAREVLRRRLGRLAGVLSVLAAAANASGALAPAELASRWLQVVAWSPALFPHSTRAILEAIMVKKTLAAIACLLLIAAGMWYAVSARAPEPSRQVLAGAPRLSSPGVSATAEWVEANAPDAIGPRPGPTSTALPAPGADAVLGSLRVKLLWARDGTPAAELGVAVWPRWCDNDLFCGRSGATGDDGVLVIDRLAPGRYSIRTARGARIGDRGWVASFEVAAGEETPLLLRVEDGNRLRGIVVDAADRPVPGAAIWLSAAAFDPVAGDVVAHCLPDGTFDVRGVGSHGLYVSARSPGYAPSSQLAVRPYTGDKELRLVLPAAGGAVRGQVLGPDGEPVEGAWVLVGERKFGHGAHVAPPPPARARTEVHGSFALEGIAPGSAPIAVRAASFAPAEAAVEVEAGRTAEVSVQLQPGALLGGRVTGADGRGVSRAQVRLGEHEEHEYGSDPTRLSVKTREDGSFSLEGAPAGEWTVHIDAGDGGRERRTVLLALGEETRLEVTLGPALRLAGRVRGADGRPLVRAMVVVWPGGRTELTDAGGRFEVKGLEDQEYALSISEPGAQIAAVRRERLRPGPQEIEIVQGEDEDASAVIAGSVVDPDGRTIRGAQVVAESVDLPGQAQRGKSGFHGAFELERLPAGTYRVRVDAEGHPRTWADVKVERGQRLDLGSVCILRPGFLAGSVARRDGGSREEVYYGIVDGHGRSALAVMLASDPTRRDPLAPGKYRLIVPAPGAAEVVREFEIEAGKETRLEVEVGEP